VVLRRVEHLEQGRRRVTAVVRTDLVHLVEQDDRVHRAGLLDRPDDAAGQRSDVRAPVSADLRLVTYAAEGDAHERAAQRPGDALAERGLADSGRTGQQHDGAGAPAATTCRPRSARRARTARYSTMRSLTSSRPWWSASRTARAALTSVESSVVTPQGSSSTVSSQVRIHPDSGLCSLARSSLSTSRSRASRTPSGTVGGLDPGAVVVSAVGLALAELLADGGQLLAQQELALALLHPFPHVRADLVGHLDLGEMLAGPGDDGLEALVDVGRLQQLALAVVGQVRRVPGRVRDGARIGHGVHGVDDLPRLATLEQRDDKALVLLSELARTVADRLGDRLDLDPQGGARAGDSASDATAPLGA
jgi:hypothetical protein